MDSKKKIMFGVAAALVVLVVLAIVAWPRKGNPCIPLSYEPSLRAIQVKNLASDDETILANMAGYVQLHEKNTYLPLEITSVQHSPPQNDISGGTISLVGQCVRMDIAYRKATKPSSQESDFVFHYKSLDMFIKDESKTSNSTEPISICAFTSKFEGKLEPSERYSCRDTHHHECGNPIGKEYDQVATLVLRSFELEFSIDASKTKEGKFSKRPKKGSCAAWES